jgi:hypothetical protein
MLKRIYLALIFIILSSVSNYAQSQNLRSIYLSAHTGAFLTANDNFDKTYDSKLGLVYGFGVGLPLSTRSYIYGKATLFSKSGTPVLQTYSFVNGTTILVSEIKEGSAKYNQWIINGGFLYKFFLNLDWTLGINGGITYSKVTEEQKNTNGIISSSINGSGIFGLFIGGVLEKNFDKSPFSIFIEPQFNFSIGDYLKNIRNYGGLNLSVGGRYYFKERRLE